VLPARVFDYRSEYLDRLCFAGEIAWGRLSPPASASRTTRVLPISFFRREDLDWLLSLRREEGEDVAGNLSASSRAVLSTLGATGAAFFTDLVRFSERSEVEVEEALRELVAAGRVTADGFETLRGLLGGERRRRASGRWSLLASTPVAPEAAVERFARQLLSRWGVVFRDLLGREPLVLPWRDLLLVYRRLEARGEIRGGRFVSGFVGEQFALPEAVELLRATRRRERKGERVDLAAADPLNVSGFILPGERVGTLSTRTLALVDGVPVEEAAADSRGA
jgi:ATP-dependent Lhr-like helicase